MRLAPRFFVVLLFTTSALVAILFFDLKLGALERSSFALVPYGAFLVSTAILALTFASWYEPGSDRWVACTILPMAMLALAILIASAIFVAVVFIFDSERLPESWRVSAFFGSFLAPGILFVMVAWPALLLGHAMAAGLSWFANSRSVRPNKSLERSRDR